MKHTTLYCPNCDGFLRLIQETIDCQNSRCIQSHWTCDSLASKNNGCKKIFCIQIGQNEGNPQFIKAIITEAK